MATDSKAPAAPASARAGAPRGAAADLQSENDRLRAKLEAAGVNPDDPAPYTPSFPMSEGIRADLEQMAARAEREGRPVDDKLPSGGYRYGVVDPVTGKVFTPKDLGN